VGEDRSGPGAEIGVQPLEPPDQTDRLAAVKPPADRLYGRQRSHPLRPRQVVLLTDTLARLRLDIADAKAPQAAFPGPVDETWLEIGFGGGEHAYAQVQAHPHAGLIACEVFENGICSLMAKLVPEGGETTAPLPPNLLVWAEDARDLLRALPDSSIAKLFLLFPDPWPKARHAKRRFVHPAQLPEIARVLRPGGEWRIASDDPTYQEWTEAVLAAQHLFEVTPPATTRPDGWPPTRYEAKALLAGRRPLYWSLTRLQS
jgi:tRNA (guanine-N7-)-methyltransferase